MKKIALVAFISGLLTLSAQAVVTITWLGPVSPATTMADGTTPAPGGWLTQFIWISNGGTMSTPTTANPFIIGGDERLLGEQALNGFNAPGRIAANVPGFAVDYGDENAGGFAYARVFNVTATTSAGAPTPTFYGVSALGGNPNIPNSVANPGVLTISTNDPNTQNNIAPVVSVNMQIVPEPSTYALLAIGGVVAFVRTRRQKK